MQMLVNKKHDIFLFVLSYFLIVGWCIMNLIPDIPPILFTLSAIAVGYILIDDLTANEQNALGNWLMLTAQVLCTNAFYKQVQNERLTKNVSNLNAEESIIIIMKKMINALKKEIDDLEDKYNK